MAAPNGWYDITAYGAVGDGTGDQADAINAAIAAIPQDVDDPPYGGVLYVPPGTFAVGAGGGKLSHIPPYVTVLGAGASVSTLLCTQNHSLLTITGAQGVGIVDLSLSYAGRDESPTHGAAISAENSSQLCIQDVNVVDAGTALWLQPNDSGEGCPLAHCERVMCSMLSDAFAGFVASGGSGDNPTPHQGLHFTDCEVLGETSGPQHGWCFEGVEDVSLTSCAGYAGEYGISIAPGLLSAGTAARSLHLVNSQFEADEQGCAIVPYDTDAEISAIGICGSQFHKSSTSVGIQVSSTTASSSQCSEINVSGSNVSSNADAGIQVNNAEAVQIGGSCLQNNGSMKSGVAIKGGSDNAVVASLLLGQRFGVDLDGGTNGQIVGNNVAGNTAGGTSISSAQAPSSFSMENFGANPAGLASVGDMPGSNEPFPNPFASFATIYIDGGYSDIAIGPASGTLTRITQQPPKGSGIRLGPGQAIKVTYSGTKPTWQWFLE